MIGFAAETFGSPLGDRLSPHLPQAPAGLGGADGGCGLLSAWAPAKQGQSRVRRRGRVEHWREAALQGKYAIETLGELLWRPRESQPISIVMRRSCAIGLGLHRCRGCASRPRDHAQRRAGWLHFIGHLQSRSGVAPPSEASTWACCWRSWSGLKDLLDRLTRGGFSTTRLSMPSWHAVRVVDSLPRPNRYPAIPSGGWLDGADVSKWSSPQA